MMNLQPNTKFFKSLIEVYVGIYGELINSAEKKCYHIRLIYYIKRNNYKYSQCFSPLWQIRWYCRQILFVTDNCIAQTGTDFGAEIIRGNIGAHAIPKSYHKKYIHHCNKCKYILSMYYIATDVKEKFVNEFDNLVVS